MIPQLGAEIQCWSKCVDALVLKWEGASRACQDFMNLRGAVLKHFIHTT